MEEDIIIEPAKEETNLDVIDSQLSVIQSIYELDENLYPEFREDKLKVIVRALKIIFKIQTTLLKDI